MPIILNAHQPARPNVVVIDVRISVKPHVIDNGREVCCNFIQALVIASPRRGRVF
ncbi:hypothetical protein D3C86_2154320 [compost metagenome]